MKYIITFCTYFILLSSATKAQTLEDGLVAYWSFDDCSLRDMSNNNHDGIRNDNALCIDGVSGKAYSFNGTNSTIVCGDGQPLSGSDNATFIAWIRYNQPSGSFGAIVTRWENRGGPQEWWFGMYGNAIHYTTQNYPCASYCEDRMSVPLSIEPGCWVMVGAIRQGNTVKYIFNGNIVDEDNGNYYNFNLVNTSIRIGRQNPDERPASLFKGDIDDVRIYNRVLTEQEIVQLYKQFATITTPSVNKNISGIINSYHTVENITTDKQTITARGIGTFSPGCFPIQKGLLIQMKGASYSTSEKGEINQYSNVGQSEFVDITSSDGEKVVLARPLRHSYDVNGNTQLVLYQQYKNAMTEGDISCSQWDGEKGGIVVLCVEDTLYLRHSVSATGKGFKGGKSIDAPTTVLRHNNMLFTEEDSTLFSLKGESICSVANNHKAGRSAIGNGGGGGCAHNAGGGGGSNGGCGGAGGYGWKEISANKEEAQGLGGYTLEVDNGRLFMGGGGGAGQSNDKTGTDGGNGGGIIYIVAKHIVVDNNGLIVCDGDKAKNSWFDGAGGGGGGGSVYISAATVQGELSVSANGGNGGNVMTHQDGPGGGGGGGVIAFRTKQFVNIVSSVKEGFAGSLSDFNKYGATSGCFGRIKENYPVIGDDLLFIHDNKGTSKEEKLFSVMPNPAVHTLEVVSKKTMENLYYELLDNVGQIIISGYFFERVLIDVKSFSSGIYTLRIKANNAFYTEQCVIVH